MSKKTRRKRRSMPASSSALVTRFSQLVLERRFAETERIFERLKEKIENNEWNRGYLQALNGILAIQKSSDERYAFLSNLNLEHEKSVEKNRKAFRDQIKSEFHADYDRGFFSAWADFLRIVLKLEKQKAKEKAEAAG